MGAISVFGYAIRIARMIKTRMINPPKFRQLANLDLHKEINESAEVVQKNIVKNFAEQRAADGSQQKSIAQATKEAKRKAKPRGKGRKGYTAKQASKVRANAEKSLLATENLKFSQLIQKATKAKQTAIITIGKQRDKIYGYLMDKGFKDVFDVDKKAERDIDKLITHKIQRLLRQI